MDKKEIIFNGDSKRVDAFLADSLDLSREFVKRMIKNGEITVNGTVKKSSYVLSPNDKILISPRSRKGGGNLKDIIAFEDEYFIAVSKPCGIAVHPNDSNWENFPETLSMGEETVASLIYSGLPGNLKLPRLGILHRLDRDTGGVMIIAKTKKFFSAMKEKFEKREIIKKYIGVPKGIPLPEAGEINAPIGRPPKSKKNVVWQYGREALTRYETIEKGRNCSLLKIRPLTGRTNQIRAHLSFIGHPIAGDILYKGPPAARLMLHALSLSFLHPETSRQTLLSVQLPDMFKSEWYRLKS